MIVHANAHDVDLRMEALANGVAEVAARLVAGEIDIEIFQLGRPMRREQPLGAAAGGPAGWGVAKAKGVHLTIGEARRAVEQQGRQDKEPARPRTVPNQDRLTLEPVRAPTGVR